MSEIYCVLASFSHPDSRDSSSSEGVFHTERSKEDSHRD